MHPGADRLEELAAIIDMLPVPAALARRAATWNVLVNRAFARMLGIDHEAYVPITLLTPPRPYAFFHDGRELENAEMPLQRTLTGEKLSAERFDMRGIDGVLHHLVVTGAPIVEDDEIVGAITVYENVGEQIRTERLLREITELTPTLMFATDAQGRIDFVNPRWSELIGRPAATLLGSGFRAYVHPHDLAGLIEGWQRHLASGEPYCTQWRVRRRDGSYRWLEIRVEPERDADDVIVRWFGAAVDVDVQKRAIDALEFLAHGGATIASERDVDTMLRRLAGAALDGLADVTFFDLVRPSGESRRLIVGVSDLAPEGLRALTDYAAPISDDRHPIGYALEAAHGVLVPVVDEEYVREHVIDPGRADVWRLLRIHSLVTAPLRIGDRSYGAITMLRTSDAVPFDRGDLRIAEEIGRRTALALENAQFAEAARRAADDVRVFADLGAKISRALTVGDTLDTVLRTLVPSYADWGLVTFADEHGDLVIAATHHRDFEPRRELATLIGTIYAGADAPGGSPDAVRRADPLIVRAATYEDGAQVMQPDTFEVIRRVGYGSALVVPFGPETTLRGMLALFMSPGGNTFDEGDAPFFREFTRRVAPQIVNAQVFERERLVARSFQDAALPGALPSAAGYRFDAIYEAGRAEALVGGDWYDAFRLLDGRIVISIGDVAGSGLRSAVTMASVRQAIRGVAHVHADPELMLESADRILRAEAPDRFVTAFVGVIDPVSSTLTYRCAGHPPPVLRAVDGTLALLDGAGLPLGLRERDDGEMRQISLLGGSLLVLYTDGLIESTHDVIEGERRVREALADPAVALASRPAKALHDAVLREGSRDDVAILTIAIDAPPERQAWQFDTRDVQAAGTVHAAFVDDLRAHGVGDEAIARGELVLAELVGNVVRYAPGIAEVLVVWDTGRPVLHVRDRGRGFAFVAKLPPDLYSESGRGLYLIAALSDDFHVARRRDGGSDARVVLRT